MPKNTTPVFSNAGNNVTASMGTTANTASDGSGTLVTIFTAGSNGSRVDSIRMTNAQATAAASSANVFRIFLTDTSGNNPRLIDEAAQATATRSTSAIGATTTFTYGTGLFLESGQLIKAAIAVYAGAQDLTHAFVRGQNF